MGVGVGDRSWVIYPPFLEYVSREGQPFWVENSAIVSSTAGLPSDALCACCVCGVCVVYVCARVCVCVCVCVWVCVCVRMSVIE